MPPMSRMSSVRRPLGQQHDDEEQRRHDEPVVDHLQQRALRPAPRVQREDPEHDEAELSPGRVTLAARVACLLPERAPESPPDQGRVPYWTPEHARRGGSREVEVEAIVNGQVVSTSAIVADGVVRDRATGCRDRAEQLGGPADPRVRAHQSDLRGDRRTPDPRLTPQRGVVPGRSGSVLVAEGAEDPQPRA